MLDDLVRIQLAMDAEDLRLATDRVLAQLQDNRCEGAINWADLACYTAIVGVDDEGGIRHEVRITEAVDLTDMQPFLFDGCDSGYCFV